MLLGTLRKRAYIVHKIYHSKRYSNTNTDRLLNQVVFHIHHRSLYLLFWMTDERDLLNGKV